jgi:coproporphyrinogen III oxidase
MSLPANASWEYNKRVEEDSKEFFTLNSLKKGINWVKG